MMFLLVVNKNNRVNNVMIEVLSSVWAYGGAAKVHRAEPGDTAW